MNQQSVRIFLAIAKYKSISKAASALNYTHPTVSEALNQLEEQVGVRLFIRKRGVRQVVLTPAGEAFMTLAQRHMELDEQLEQFISAQKRKKFCLAASSSAHEYLVYHIVQRLMQKVPGLEISLISKSINEVSSEMDKNSFDAAIYFGKELKHPMFEELGFFEEKRYILCPSSTVLPDRVISVEELDVKNEVQYLLTNKTGNFYKWHQEYFSENVSSMVSVDTSSALKNYLRSPESWAIVPASIAHNIISQHGQDFTFRNITPEPVNRRCRLILRRYYPHSEIMQAFLQCCKEYLEERPYLIDQLDLSEL